MYLLLYCIFFNDFNIFLFFVVDIIEIKDLFAQFKTLCIGKTIPKKVFYKSIGSLFKHSNMISKQLYKFFTPNNSDEIDFISFAKGVYTLSRGSVQQKLYLAFKCYDTDGDGFITKDDLHDMILAQIDFSQDAVKSDFRSYGQANLMEWDEKSSDPVSSAFNGLVSILNNANSNDDDDNDIGEGPDLREFDSLQAYNEQKDFNDYIKFREKITARITKKAMETLDFDANGRISLVGFLLWIKSDKETIRWLDYGGTIF